MNLAWPLVVLGVATAAHGESDVTKLSTTAGTYVRLSDLFRSRPTVLFYEDKDTNQLNQPLKDTLYALGKARSLLDAASVVAIANVQGFDWFPARNFVVTAVKKTEVSIGVPVYLDWDGTMTKKPWSLNPKNATVMVLDPKGAVQFSYQGKLTEQKTAEVLALLEKLIEANQNERAQR
ncbi:MAG: hypothetical protein IPJ65_29370 [Archangiaceae bacterium]|nr:hypothetical protein [Archangiaceae bacterium]